MVGRVLQVASRGGPRFPPAAQMRPTTDGLVALGGDLRPETLLEAYRKGVFPWEGEQPIPWFSPDPRGVLFPEAFRVSHSLSKVDRRGTYRVTADVRFREVMRGCATVLRPGQRGTWISDPMIEAYETLYFAGVAHSVEVWEGEELVGGLYGLAIGRVFFGESMYALRPNASKLGFLRLCRTLERWGFRMVDCQQYSPHLGTLGAITMPRSEYLERLDRDVQGTDRWNPDGADLLML